MPVHASHYHQINGFIELVLSHYPLQVLVHHVAHLGAGITGYILHYRVQLLEVIGRWGLASLVFSLCVGKVSAESR